VDDWRTAYAGSDATIFARPSADELVRVEKGAAPEILRREPGRWEFDWKGVPGAGSARLVIAETWDPGWRASLDGRPLAVEAVDELWLGVRPGDDPGRLVVRYVPQGLAWGAAASALGGALLGFGFVLDNRRSRRLRANRS
jgi:hypothetical protein